MGKEKGDAGRVARGTRHLVAAGAATTIGAPRRGRRLRPFFFCCALFVVNAYVFAAFRPQCKLSLSFFRLGLSWVSPGPAYVSPGPAYVSPGSARAGLT